MVENESKIQSHLLWQNFNNYAKMRCHQAHAWDEYWKGKTDQRNPFEFFNVKLHLFEYSESTKTNQSKSISNRWNGQ